MPELRQNLATKDWVVISSERAMRPADFKSEKPAAAPAPDYSQQCPFCPGNEALAAPSPFVLTDEKSAWKIRVVQNKFPALVAGAGQPKTKQSLYHSLPGEGVHEVIIDSPSHGKSPAQFDRGHMVDLVGVYKDRFKACLENEKVALPLLFKNHGLRAGTSLAHSHSQIIGSSVIPSHIRYRMDEAQRYFDQNKACVFCAMIKEELRQKVRILADTESFCAFVPFAALSPFHVWILPKRHTPSFVEMTPKETEDFAAVLQNLLKRFYVGLNNPDYNYVIQSTPLDRGVTETASGTPACPIDPTHDLEYCEGACEEVQRMAAEEPEPEPADDPPFVKGEPGPTPASAAFYMTAEELEQPAGGDNPWRLILHSDQPGYPVVRGRHPSLAAAFKAAGPTRDECTNKGWREVAPIKAVPLDPPF